MPSDRTPRDGSTARLAAAALLAVLAVPAGTEEIPYNQDRPPGPPLSPEEALRRMRVPEGFAVERVASEPDIVNPVAMAFDEEGRIWITESLEYPRSDPGPGRDRVKILLDTDRDGAADVFQVFAEGLNIPSGIAPGRGGVYVACAPDILFLEDTDGDLRADRRTVVLTGFGRHDTHEVPNTLTWGPDGWLYGLNGVFNPAQIEHQGETREFTCALWRLHPRTGRFEVFAEGTSNPRGLAFDREGSAFVEACVIDHLYHLTETGIYHRQAGPYPPFTWKIESIVDHHHQKAAYCGLAIYDADLYPEPYRGRIFMGNIHGGCVNMDRLERDGSTYRARAEEDFLSARDVWFMPVAIHLGPDGCLYVLDWYDRYHCYQDARRDPRGIDRLRGRLWRVTYGAAPRPAPVDLARESSPALVARLRSPSGFWRSQARRILAERCDPASYPALKELVSDADAPRAARMEALWTLVSCEDPGARPRVLEAEWHLGLLEHPDPGIRSWAVRAAGDLRRVDPRVGDRVAALARDPHPDVRLQVAVAARKLLAGGRALETLLAVLEASAGDPLIPRIAWRNLEPLLEKEASRLVAWLGPGGSARLEAAEVLLGRIVERLLARRSDDPAPLAEIVRLLLASPGDPVPQAASCLEALRDAVLESTAGPRVLETLRSLVLPALGPVVEVVEESGNAGTGPLYAAAVTLAAAWGEPGAVAAAKALALSASREEALRIAALRALLHGGGDGALEVAGEILGRGGAEPPGLLREALAGLGRLESDEVARLMLEVYPRLPPPLGAQAIDLLTQRASWGRALAAAAALGRVERARVGAGQLRRLLALGDDELARQVGEVWGSVRLARDPERERVIERMRRVLGRAPGDPGRGQAVFDRVCAQCHRLFDRGNAVGPDITQTGRETLDQLLSSVLDPNLVVGRDYQAHTLVTATGRVLSGLLVEESDRRVVLRLAGGEEEVVPRREVVSLTRSEVSLMPEDLEAGLSDQEFRDLVAYLRLEEPLPPPSRGGAGRPAAGSGDPGGGGAAGGRGGG